jgi:hypothetical protein
VSSSVPKFVNPAHAFGGLGAVVDGSLVPFTSWSRNNPAVDAASDDGPTPAPLTQLAVSTHAIINPSHRRSKRTTR